MQGIKLPEMVLNGEFTYRNNQKNGPARLYNPKGQLDWKIEYENGAETTAALTRDALQRIYEAENAKLEQAGKKYRMRLIKERTLLYEIEGTGPPRESGPYPIDLRLWQPGLHRTLCALMNEPGTNLDGVEVEVSDAEHRLLRTASLGASDCAHSERLEKFKHEAEKYPSRSAMPN